MATTKPGAFTKRERRVEMDWERRILEIFAIAAVFIFWAILSEIKRRLGILIRLKKKQMGLENDPDFFLD